MILIVYSHQMIYYLCIFQFWHRHLFDSFCRGLTLHSLLTFLTHGALRHTAGEVRDKAERLIVNLYEHIGSPVKDYLLNSDEKTRKSLLYKQLFKAFERIDQTRRGTDNDDGDANKSHYESNVAAASQVEDNAKEPRHRGENGGKVFSRCFNWLGNLVADVTRCHLLELGR